MQKNINIAAIERDTGLGKDTLRVWERRYGFPAPERDENGERVYAPSDLDKIRLVQRLMHQGHRPGKIMHLDIATLGAMLNLDTASNATNSTEIEIVRLLKTHQISEIHQYLRNLLIEQGLARFVTDSLSIMNTQVGDAWMQGQLAIFEEHAYSEQVQAILRATINQLSSALMPPKILLTTLPGEQHILGLLMAEAMLTLAGATCINLGAQIPVYEINAAMRAHQADVLCLSFNTAFPKNQCLQSLAELHQLLPAKATIWVGGQGVPKAKLSTGVQHIPTLSGLEPAVHNWRAR
ncbi:MerR family transcriptional regulator [Sulfuriferula nivalis]|uniref:MerR family transcriptional regulator n=1 Tax=Sulfuriferula nivalis TaxID=2675298 RepID=A0A809RH74_9PROT|nr:MerR family transcriptional regulator [Sulfuriferula nivalis]BBP00905.1 MerR family transcriptional regulator [Sulfuriferula nivalis]